MTDVFAKKDIMLSEVHKIAINYEITKKNRRKILKNRNIYKFSFEIQNYFVTLQPK